MPIVDLNNIKFDPVHTNGGQYVDLNSIQFDRQPLQAPEDSGLFSRIGQDYNQRTAKQGEINDAFSSGQQGGLNTAFQGLSNAAGMFGDAFINEPLKSVASALANPQTEIGKQAIQPFKDMGSAALGVLNQLGNTGFGQSVGRVANYDANALSQLAPPGSVARRDISALGDLANSVPAFGMLMKAAPLVEAGVKALPEAIPAIASGAKSSMIGGGKQAAKAAAQGNVSDRFLQNLVTPKLTKAEEIERFSRSRAEDQGLVAGYTPPSANEQSAMDAIKDLPVSRKNTLLKNYNIIDDANVAEADNLSSMLEKNNTIIDKNDLQKRISNVIEKAKEDSLNPDTAETAANQMTKMALRFADENGYSPPGLLKSRKQFDAWAKENIPKAFDDPVRTPGKKTQLAVRKVFNDMIAEAAPEANVKASLAKQSAMFDALEAIESKGADAARTQAGRMVKFVKKETPSVKSMLGANLLRGK